MYTIHNQYTDGWEYTDVFEYIWEYSWATWSPEQIQP